MAADNLRIGIDVVADSCNRLVLTRRDWDEVARESGATSINIEVVCTDAREHRRRVETRSSNVPGLKLPTWDEILAREYHDWTTDRLIVDTAGRSEGESFDELMVALAERPKAT